MGIDILFRLVADTEACSAWTSASASPPSASASPRAATPHGSPRHRAPPPRLLRFVVHVKSWRSSLAAGSRPAEMRARVHTVARRTVPDGDGGLIARATLYPEDIVAYHHHPDRSVTPVRLSMPARSVLPTFVVHVPSRLNPDLRDASIAFAPNTMSWLYRPRGASRPRELERPRINVPCYSLRSRHARFRTRTPAMAAHFDDASVRYAIL